MNTMKYKTILIATMLLITGATFAVAQEDPEDFEEPEDGPAIQLEKQFAEPEPLQIGNYANVFMKAHNIGDEEAENVTISLEDKFPFETKQDRDNEWRFREIDDGESVSFRATVRVDSTAVQEDDAELKFWSSIDSDSRRTHYIENISLRVDDTSLIIDSIDFPDRVVAGSTNELTVSLENMVNNDFRNIDVNLELDDPELEMAPVESSRERISHMSANANEEVNFDLNVDEDADNGVYKLPIRLTYETETGQQVETQQTTGIVVGGSPEIRTGIENTEILTGGTRDSITFNVINRGPGESRYTEIGILENETDNVRVLSERTEYLGTMISDDYQTAEFDFHVSEEQEEDLEIPIEVTYVNEDGEMTTEVQNVTNRIYSDEEMDLYGLGNEETGLIILIVLGVVAVAGGVLYYRRSNREE